MSSNKPTDDNLQSQPMLSGELNSVVPAANETPREKEIGGQKGPEPTRFGDWEKNGRCSDF